jgi:hypothetical protein
MKITTLWATVGLAVASLSGGALAQHHDGPRGPEGRGIPPHRPAPDYRPHNEHGSRHHRHCRVVWHHRHHVTRCR